MIRQLVRPDPVQGSGPSARNDPRVAPALRLLRQGRFPEAALAFEAAIDTHAPRGPALAWWAAEARTAAGLARFHAGDLVEARSHLEWALVHVPRYPGAGEYLARIHYRCGLPREALAALEGPVGAAGRIEIPLLRAVCLGRLGETERATRALDWALALGMRHPLGSVRGPGFDGGGGFDTDLASDAMETEYPDHRCQRAARLVQHRPHEAAAQLEAAVGTNPRFLRARVALALLSLQLGRVSRSQTLLQGARELEPCYPDVLAWLGLARLRGGDARGAIRSLQAALRLNREFGRAHRFLALAHHALGHEREALEAAHCGLARERDVPVTPHRARLPGLETESSAEEELVQALAIRPASADFHLALGRRRAARGALHPARQAIGRALEIQPDFAAARVELARVELSLGRMAEAEALLASAARGQPGWIDVLALLGRTRLLMGRARDAVLPLRAALRQRPGLEAAREDLAWALQSLGHGSVRGGRAAWWEPAQEPAGVAS